MKNLAKIFTRERVIYGIVISLIGLFGTVYTARSQAASKTQEDLNNFKQTTIEQLGDVRGDIKALKVTSEMTQGLVQTMSSRLNTFIDKQK